MVTSEPNSGSVGESPTPVDTVPELGGGEDPPRPPSVATTEAGGMDGTQEEAKALHVSNVGSYVHARRILHSIHVVP